MPTALMLTHINLLWQTRDAFKRSVRKKTTKHQKKIKKEKKIEAKRNTVILPDTRCFLSCSLGRALVRFSFCFTKTNIRIINVNFPLCFSILRRFFSFFYRSMETIISWKAILNKKKQRKKKHKGRVVGWREGWMSFKSKGSVKCSARATSLSLDLKITSTPWIHYCHSHSTLLIWIISCNYIFIISSSPASLRFSRTFFCFTPVRATPSQETAIMIRMSAINVLNHCN